MATVGLIQDHGFQKMITIGRYCMKSCSIQDRLVLSNLKLFSTTSCFHKRRKDERHNPVRSTPDLRSINVAATIGSSKTRDRNSVFKPVLIKPNPDDLNFGEEIAGKINKQALLKELNSFYNHPEMRQLCREHGLDDYLYNQAYTSFRRFCMDVQHLPTELYILFSDVLCGAQHNHDIFPYFLSHAKKVFPHLSRSCQHFVQNGF